MQQLPYLEILKRAYEFTSSRPWLWIYGLFVGGLTSLNFSSLNYFFSPASPQRLEFLKALASRTWKWLETNAELFWGLFFLTLLASFILLALSGISRGAIVWTAARLARAKEGPVSSFLGETEGPTFGKALRAAKAYFWRIISIQIWVSLAFVVVSLVLSWPIFYFFSLQAFGRAIALLFLGIAIFIPASLMLGFLHLYGPIFVVLYGRSISGAIQLSFSLLLAKLKESILLAAFLVGMNLLFFFGLIFSIILAGVPVSLVALLLVKLGLVTALHVWLLGWLFVGVGYVLLMGGAFAVFQNIAWVLAVEEMVKTKKLPKEQKALAAEPV